eukprot:SAG11_NODE_24618_length_370_cov_2.073801_1_plen_82_part_01
MQYKILGAVLQYEKGSRCHTAAIRRAHGGADAAKRIGSAVSADLRYYMYEYDHPTTANSVYCVAMGPRSRSQHNTAYRCSGQ